MQQRITITEKRVAAVFASARQRKIVQSLMGGEMSLGALARATQMPLSLLHYHVSKGIGVGLIEIVRELPRAGRAVKLYRATAKAFFVPAELIVEMPGTGLTQQLRESLDRNLARSLRGVEFTHDGHSPRAHLLKEPSTGIAAIELWLDAGLGKDDADALAHELQAVIDRFRARGRDGEPRYLVHLAAVRV